MQNPSKNDETVDTGMVKENVFVREYERKNLQSTFLKKQKKNRLDRKTGLVGCDSLRIGELKKATYTTIIVTRISRSIRSIKHSLDKNNSSILSRPSWERMM